MSLRPLPGAARPTTAIPRVDPADVEPVSPLSREATAVEAHRVGSGALEMVSTLSPSTPPLLFAESSGFSRPGVGGNVLVVDDHHPVGVSTKIVKTKRPPSWEEEAGEE